MADLKDDTAWLDEPAKEPATDVAEPLFDTDWLALPDGAEVTVDRARAPYADILFACMRGTARVWACNGEYVAYRPHNHALDKEVNPRTAERHQQFLASGHYEHVGTFDEVQIFKLLEGSPFKRIHNSVMIGVNLHQDMRTAAKAAVARDWVLYHDILDSIATNIKSRFDAGMAKQMFDDVLTGVEQGIRQRGGPSQAEVDAGFQNVRLKRGVGRGRVIALPSAARVQ